MRKVVKSVRVFVIIVSLSVTTAVYSQTISATETAGRVISVDMGKVKCPLNMMFKTCVGAGRANEGLRADWQRQMAYVHDQCGFSYVRMHGLFTDDMGVYHEDQKTGKAQYNWQYVDELYDFLIRIKMKPFVELGFTPNDMVSGKETIFWWRGNTSLPKDGKKWADLVRATVTHWKERYGEDEVRSWYFEVWNEPNLQAFFNGTQQQYFDLYGVTARAIKSVSPAYRVGGPATAGAAWVPEFIDYCVKNHAPVDFVSSHTYGVESGFLDEMGNKGTVLSHDPMSIIRDVRGVRESVKKSGMPKLEAHITEWSTSYTPADPVHDSYHSAAFICDKIKQCGDAVQSMSYWTFTDIFEEAGPRFTPFHGGFGLLNYQDIRKPAFFAYQFLNRLGPTELQNADGASYVCKDPAGNVQALLWDFTVTNPADVNNQVYYLRDLPPKPKGSVKVHLTGLQAGKYAVAIYKVGYRVNDAFDTYKDLGSPAQLTRDQVSRLNAVSDGKPIEQINIVIGSDGTFDRVVQLRENDVFLFVLDKK